MGMNEVYVYGVVSAAETVTPPEGTRLVRHRDVAALIGEVPPGRQLATAALREHWRILEALAAEVTVLPVRFGTATRGEDAVVPELLEPRHDALAGALAGLAGKVQLTVKGFYDGETMLRDVVARSPAIARLRAQVAELPEAAAYAKRIQLGQLVAGEVEQARERDGALVRDRLEGLAVASRLERTSGPDAAVNMAFLVERRGIGAFSQAVAQLGRELAGYVRLRYVGPLPPYGFADADAEVATWA
jgi:hypothetical protein